MTRTIPNSASLSRPIAGALILAAGLSACVPTDPTLVEVPSSTQQGLWSKAWPVEIASVSGRGTRRHPAADAYDGDMNTYFAPRVLADYVELELGYATYLETIDVAWYGGRLQGHWFEVHVSTDGGETFREVENMLSEPTTDYFVTPILFGRPVTHVRIHANGGGETVSTGIREVRVVGRAADPSIPSPGGDDVVEEEEPAEEEPVEEPVEEEPVTEEPTEEEPVTEEPIEEEPVTEEPTEEEPVTTPAGSPLRELHVSQSGSDGAAGTASNPWRTLSYAASQLQAGDWLYVHGGPWNEGMDLSASGTASNPIRIIAADNASFDLTNNVTGAGSVFAISGSNIHVVGFDITASITAFDLGDGLYPLNDVCNNLAAFQRGTEEAEHYGYCDNRPASNHRVSNIVIDGWNSDAGRRGVIDLAATPTSWQLGVNLADEVSNVAIRNYEMANMRHAVFADGQDMVRVVDGLSLENLYVHDTRNYGVRIVSRDTFIPSSSGSGQRWASYEGGTVYLEENMVRSQTIRNVTISRSSFVHNGYTDVSTGEGYGNMLLQGIEGGVVERSAFIDGPYWGIDALICDDMIFRNNVFHVSDSVRYAERTFPDPQYAWPLVGLEVNGGTNNKVYNNVFHNFESGLFESYFPEDFARTTISVDVQNNIFQDNVTSIMRFPATEWLSNGAEVVPNGSMVYIPEGGMTVQRTESNNMMDIGVNYDLNSYGQLVQYLNGDQEFYGTGNVVDASLNFAFTDVSSGDFHLGAGSAAIDRGVSLSEVTDDFDGNTRGANVDVGPFER